MKIGLKLILILSFCFLGTGQLQALTINKEGDSFSQDDRLWQLMKLEDSDYGYSATLPGNPYFEIQNGCIYFTSIEDEVFYVVQASPDKAPHSARSFLKQVKSAWGDEAIVTVIEPKADNILYAVDIAYPCQTKKMRALCTKNMLFICAVVGDDLSLAETFFDSLKISE